MTTIKEKCQRCGSFRDRELLRSVRGTGLVCRACPKNKDRRERHKPFAVIRERMREAGWQRSRSWFEEVLRDMGVFISVLAKMFDKPFSEVGFAVMLQVARQEEAEKLEAALEAAKEEEVITQDELNALFGA